MHFFFFMQMRGAVIQNVSWGQLFTYWLIDTRLTPHTGGSKCCELKLCRLLDSLGAGSLRWIMNSEWYSHLSHGLRQVGGDGSEAPPSAVHDVVAAGTHGRTGAWRQAARLNEGAVAMACKQARRKQKQLHLQHPHMDLSAVPHWAAVPEQAKSLLRSSARLRPLSEGGELHWV